MTESAKEFHIPADTIAKMAPLLLRGQIKEALLHLDELDLNHDHKRDVAQVMTVVAVLMPVASKINDAIDFDAFAKWVCEQPFVKDKAVVAEIIKDVCHAIEKA